MFNLEDCIVNSIDDFQKKMICKKLNSYRFNEAAKASAILRVLNIAPQYNWIGHRGEWFYPTLEDVDAQEEWIWQCADYDCDYED